MMFDICFQLRNYYLSIEEMQGWQILKKYFNQNNLQSLKLLTDKNILKRLLEDTALVLFLRYLQNLNQINLETFLKTLLLLIRLIKLSPSKICILLPFQQIKRSQCKHSNLHECQELLLQKIIDYVNYLIRQEQMEENYSGQLECLTTKLFQIYHLIQYKNTSIANYAKFFYWLVEERLYQMYMIINNDLNNFEILQLHQFKEFYQHYCDFCKFKRKIPKIRHKNLKSIEILYETNQKIEQRYKQLLQEESNQRDMYHLENKMKKFVVLMVNEDWDDE